MKQFAEKAVSRRGVIRGLGGGAVAALGKGLGKSAQLAGIRGRASGAGGTSIETAVLGAHDDKISKLLRTLKVMPEFKIREFRREAKYVRDFDVDIASYQSVSISARVAMQRERNFQRAKSNFFDSHIADDHGRFAFLEKHGLNWF